MEWVQYDLVLPYGSVQFIRQLKESSLARFVLHDESRFATSAWSAVFGLDALNGAGRHTSVAEVMELLQDSPRHLRPDMVDKAFSGGVFDVPKWESIRIERGLADDLDCWISPLQSIETEWRCWVVGGKVIEISKYRDGGEMSLARQIRPEVWMASQRFADRYLPAPCVVLDLALADGRYSLLSSIPSTALVSTKQTLTPSSAPG